MLNGREKKLTITKIRTKMKMTEIDFSDFLTQVRICLLNKNEEQKDLKEEESFSKRFLKQRTGE